MTKRLPVVLLALLTGCEAQRVLDNYGASLDQHEVDSLLTPEQLAQAAARLESCGVHVAPPNWPTRRVAVLRASLRMPPDFHLIDGMQEKGSEFWIGPDDASYMFSLSTGGDTYFLAPGEAQRPIEQRSCQAPLLGHAVPWFLDTWVGSKDTSFMAMTSARIDARTSFSAALLSKTRSAREAMMRSLLSLHMAK